MAWPSAGGLSLWPESRSERMSRSSKMRCAANSARLDTDDERTISWVMAWRAASVSSGVGAAACAMGSSGCACSATSSVLMVSGRPSAVSSIVTPAPFLNCTCHWLEVSAMPRVAMVMERTLTVVLSSVMASVMAKWRRA